MSSALRMVVSWVEMTDRTDTSMRLNSSKQPHAPHWHSPENILPTAWKTTGQRHTAKPADHTDPMTTTTTTIQHRQHCSTQTVGSLALMSRIFNLGGGKTEVPKAVSGGVGFIGRGQQPPPHRLGGWGSAVSSPSGVHSGAPTAQRFSTIFSTQDGLS